MTCQRCFEEGGGDDDGGNLTFAPFVTRVFAAAINVVSISLIFEGPNLGNEFPSSPPPVPALPVMRSAGSTSVLQ